MTDLNLKAISLGATGISAHAKKSDAIKAAVGFGWSAHNVTRAANRFWRFWVICQGVGSDTLRLLREDGSWLDIPHPGRW